MRDGASRMGYGATPVRTWCGHGNVSTTEDGLGGLKGSTGRLGGWISPVRRRPVSTAVPLVEAATGRRSLQEERHVVVIVVLLALLLLVVLLRYFGRGGGGGGGWGWGPLGPDGPDDGLAAVPERERSEVR
jgi:hypothetical protein